ncbi:AI-2E family transporter [Candidatus Peregrinibacteria bacterium]|nr:AI-2E family transporter [Candidatus Peregrinibacteria bacterium]
MKQFQLTFLHIAILLSILFLGAVISPFLTTLILAAILVTGTYPIYEWILKKVKNRNRLAAVIMSLSIGIIFSAVLFVFIILLSDEAVSTYQNFEVWLQSGKLNLSAVILKASKYIGVPRVDIISSITQAAQTFSTNLVSQSTEFLKSIAWMILNFFLLVFTMYFFYKDGKAIVAYVEKIMPVPHPYGSEIFQKFRQVSLAMLYGIFLTAILQGILGGIGLAVAGIRNPIFWGTLMALFGMLPVGGTGIIWLPASIFLLAGGHYIAGIGLLIWGGLIVAFVDNLVKPIVISTQTKIYPLATFLVVIGGLLVFGLKGAIIAPMVLAAFLSFIHIRTQILFI